jgi:subtilase family serine protease
MRWTRDAGLRSRTAHRAVSAGLTVLATVAVLGSQAVPAVAAPLRTGTSGADRGTLAPYVVEWSRLAGHGGNATSDLGPATAGALISARVYLAGRDPRGLAAYAASVSDPSRPSFHDYLTPAQVAGRYGPDARQVAAIRSWLSSSGLRITAVTEHYIAVGGTAAEAQSAFGAIWHSYQVDGLTQQAPPPAAQLSAPAGLAPAVLTVAPLETGLPGSPAFAQAAAPGIVAAGAGTPEGGKAAVPAGEGPLGLAVPAAADPSCSGYYGQNLATSLPPAYGRTVPYYVCGYTPQQLRAAYGVPGALTARGVTVAVIHPWRQQTAAQDLATFAARHGEPLRPGQFTQILPAGLDASCEGTTQGPFPLSNEETGDVELVHATAPDAKIVYVGAKCDDGEGTVQDLDAMTTVVDGRLATIVSNSWAAVASDAELSAGLVGAYEQIFEQGAAEGIGFYFAAGDGGEFSGGSAGGQPTLIYPQSDPWVTSVGGTSLAVGPAGRYEWETGWGDRAAEPAADGTSWAGLPGEFAGGSGGGTSTLFRQPSYQRGVVPAALSQAHGSATPMRVVPDIAADADPFTGVLVGETLSAGAGQPPVYQEGPGGGTSASCPLIAGIQADVQQMTGGAPIGFANPVIYARYGTRAYHDVTGEPLGPGFTPAVALPAGLAAAAPILVTLGLDEGLAATPGYDDVTGVGSPAPDYFASYRR